ncbi:hypothetical protein LTR86_002396 [Recurvomyces mirabilis]|nr:hypothetical protein LTR86_002396 [Recurvomyces mirabilis]
MAYSSGACFTGSMLPSPVEASTSHQQVLNTTSGTITSTITTISTSLENGSRDTDSATATLQPTKAPPAITPLSPRSLPRSVEAGKASHTLSWIGTSKDSATQALPSDTKRTPSPIETQRCLDVHMQPSTASQSDVQKEYMGYAFPRNPSGLPHGVIHPPNPIHVQVMMERAERDEDPKIHSRAINDCPRNHMTRKAGVYGKRGRRCDICDRAHTKYLLCPSCQSVWCAKCYNAIRGKRRERRKLGDIQREERRADRAVDHSHHPSRCHKRRSSMTGGEQGCMTRKGKKLPEW